MAPFIILGAMVGLTMLASQLQKDERQYDQVRKAISDILDNTLCLVCFALYSRLHIVPQDLYAIEEDDLYNKRLVWTGTKWVDESTGHVVKLAAAHPQRTQELLLMQVRAHV